MLYNIKMWSAMLSTLITLPVSDSKEEMPGFGPVLGRGAHFLTADVKSETGTTAHL